ncbi:MULTISPECIES: 3'-5' exonuclease [unclassified Brucella]|uniref:3'-5' exonuclease n=1 Tax=unclassified Brucella TaxID=2632610 RepID=UPI0009728237|nr:3'-5' exonuclease [Brucella sp. 09RB8471]APX68550.1 hypothetical protein BKD03_03775 [Brucella sp. 09RB8471]MRN77662.1 AAA family ATPase [Brucella sp. 10RB9210]
MPFPVPVERQREVVCLPAKGHQVVLGTAGSGKTTMAILRAAQLADPEHPEHGPVLLLTFNKSLGAYIRHISAARLKNVRVEHYHKFAIGYLNHLGLMGRNFIIRPIQRKALIADAVEEIRKEYKPHSFFDRTSAFFEAEVAWIAKNGIADLNSYLEAERIGRGVALSEGLRKIVWKIREVYHRLRNDRGYQYDWDDISGAVLDGLIKDLDARKYKHIVIDEGQDLSPQMLRSIACAIPKDGTITFFGDVAQQIYGQRVSWRSAGLKPPKVWAFNENYRNSREIAALGLAIAKMDYYRDVPDMVAPNTPKAADTKPTLVRIQPGTDEYRFVADQATSMSTNRSVAILVRTVSQQTELRKYLPRNAINLRDDGDVWVDGPSLYVGTYHSAKGLEFDAVILPFMEDSLFPDPSQVIDFGDEEADANDGRLLYVGVTRAKSNLIITFKGKISHLLPTNRALYTEVLK